MNTDWKDFLTEQITQNEQSAADSAQQNAQAEQADIICDLSHYGLIVIAGPDAAAFMQGQFTNDVQQVNEQQAQLSALCNNKGRMIANFTLFQYQQNYFLSVHQSLLETTIERLQTYILSAQVAVQDVSEQLVAVGIAGKEVCNRLHEVLPLAGGQALIQQAGTVIADDNYIMIKTADKLPRYQIFANVEKARELWLKLCNTAEVVHGQSWEYLNIQCGIPVINAHTSEQLIPQMANMEILDGVNFKKGCYTGQEIVARMHYLGKLKKRMYRVHIDTPQAIAASPDSQPRSGDKVFAKNATAGQNTGMLIDAQAAPGGGYSALAVLQIADAESELSLHDINGPAITLESLPYSFD